MRTHFETHATRMHFDINEVLRVYDNRSGNLIETMKVINYTKPSKDTAGAVFFQVTRVTNPR